MASEVLKALFTAKENISDTLEKIDRATSSTQNEMGMLSAVMQEAENSVDTADGAFDEMSVSLAEFDRASQSANSAADRLEDSLLQLASGSVSTEEGIEEVHNALAELAVSTTTAEEKQHDLVSEFRKVATSGDVSELSIGGVHRQLIELVGSAGAANEQLNELAQELIGASVGAKRTRSDINGLTKGVLVSGKAFDHMNTTLLQTTGRMGLLSRSAEGASESVDDVRNSSLGAAGALTTLNSVITDSILNFGSLSVNIGPFNIALRNFITQVPAILTGMGSMVSLITALIAGFGTLAVVSGALIAGGALAFFEEFSANFEDSTEAIEAMGAALKNLFVDALAPLMNDTNADLFIDVVNGMANVVNRFAQFANQMRDEVLSVFRDVEGDVDDFYNALRNTFILLRPVITGFINFFLQDFPAIMERMGLLSRSLSGNIDVLLTSLGKLLSQLLDLASTILAGVAPAARIIISVLTGLAGILNWVHSRTVSFVIALGILSIAGLKLIGVFTGLGVALTNLNAHLITNAAAGGLLGGVYTVLTRQAQAYVMTNMSLWTAITDTIAAIKVETASWWMNVKAKIAENLVLQVLGKTYRNFIAWLKATVVWQKLSAAVTWVATVAKWGFIAAILTSVHALFGEAAALKVAAVGLAIYDAAALAAAGATWLLNAAIGVLTSPIWLVIGAVGLLIAAFIDFIGLFDVTGFAADFFAPIIDWITGIIDAVKNLIGLGGKAGGNMPGVANPDAISTNPNVNLSFKDELNQQVDVQADPEDKEGLRRIVKDAMNEANSVARRSEGVGR